VAAIICPMPDPFSMCLFASPMLALYFVGVGVAWFVHPDHRKRKEKTAA
jgi:sec-independent protein translocase protein TatC